MRTILTVTTPATVTNLTTRDRVKRELSIADNSDNDILDQKIAEASADIEAALGFRVPNETVSELFWHEVQEDVPEYCLLNRTPVTTLTSVTLDDNVVDPSLYRLDPNTGQLYALDVQGYPFRWVFQKSIVVVYAGGYLLPGQSGSNLPAGIEGATIELMTDFWMARGRDPSIKSETDIGVRTVDYWVGSIGDPAELPPRVLMKLAPYRRIVV